MAKESAERNSKMQCSRHHAKIYLPTAHNMKVDKRRLKGAAYNVKCEDCGEEYTYQSWDVRNKHCCCHEGGSVGLFD